VITDHNGYNIHIFIATVKLYNFLHFRSGEVRFPRIKHVCRRAAIAFGQPKATFPFTLSALSSVEKQQLFADDTELQHGKQFFWTVFVLRSLAAHDNLPLNHCSYKPKQQLHLKNFIVRVVHVAYDI
jgi:hypothetical protein